MGEFVDFSVRWDRRTDSGTDLIKKIIYSIIVRRLKSKKPVTIGIFGGSGEGKSWAALRIQEIVLEIYGFALRDYLKNINVYVPPEYPKKIDGILYDKKLRKINMLCVHESRELVKAKMWNSWLNETISDVNAVSRSVKRICFIFISQYVKDVDPKVRRTLNYYIKCKRPTGEKTRLDINILYEDDADIEKPRIKKRGLRGYVTDNNGRRRLWVPKYIEVAKPSKEITEEFEAQEYEAKGMILRHKIEKLIAQMNIEYGQESPKVEAMVEHYINNPESMRLIGKFSRGKWKASPNFKRMHELSEMDCELFLTRLTEKMKIKKMISYLDDQGDELEEEND